MYVKKMAKLWMLCTLFYFLFLCCWLVSMEYTSGGCLHVFAGDLPCIQVHRQKEPAPQGAKGGALLWVWILSSYHESGASPTSADAQIPASSTTPSLMLTEFMLKKQSTQSSLGGRESDCILNSPRKKYKCFFGAFFGVNVFSCCSVCPERPSCISCPAFVCSFLKCRR